MNGLTCWRSQDLRDREHGPGQQGAAQGHALRRPRRHDPIGHGHDVQPAAGVPGALDSRKEIVYMGRPAQDRPRGAREAGTRNLNLKSQPRHRVHHRRRHGGRHARQGHNEHSEERGANKAMYHAITIIVDGAGRRTSSTRRPRRVPRAARFSRRAARASTKPSNSSPSTSSREGDRADPLRTEQTDAIVESIRKELSIDEPGKGILFVRRS